MADCALTHSAVAVLGDGMNDITKRKCGIHPDVSTAGGRCGACDAEAPEPRRSLAVAQQMLAMVERNPEGYTEMSNEGLAVLLRAYIERHVLRLQLRHERAVDALNAVEWNPYGYADMTTEEVVATVLNAAVEHDEDRPIVPDSAVVSNPVPPTERSHGG